MNKLKAITEPSCARHLCAFVKFTLCVLFLHLITGCASLVPKKSNDPYFYVVAADPQLFLRQVDDRNWVTAIEHINRLKPDFVIVCGDLTHCANNPEKWKDPEIMASHEKLARAYLEGAKELREDINLYNVAGNHDVSLKPNEQTLTWYRSRFGEPWYSFEHKNSLFVVLESNLMRDPSGAPEEGQAQWDWLDRTLEETAKRVYDHKTVYMHHPLCVRDVDEKNDYHNINQAPRKELLKRFHKYGFEAVFCGHLHRNAHMKDGDLELVVTGSSGVGTVGKNPLGFRIVKMFPDRLEHAFHTYEELPAAVDLSEPEQP